MFETQWMIAAPIEEVFEIISHPAEYSAWWPSVVVSQLVEEGDADGEGATAAYTIRSPLGYRMAFGLKTIEVERPNRFRGLVRGDLVGTGTHYLDTVPDGTRVRFHWYVSTTRRWMNLLAPVARPAFGYAHRRVMYEGCEAMARTLGAQLLSAESRMVDSPTPVPALQE